MVAANVASRSEVSVADHSAVAGVPVARLRPRYYLDHFSKVVEGVRARYNFLLSDHERRHLAAVEALTDPARMLYARLVNRRGPCFRLDRLQYLEIGALDLPVAELLLAGLLEPCDERLDPALRPRLLACFNHSELKARLRSQGMPRHARKEELLAWLAAWDRCSTWLAEFLAEHAVVRIPQADPWPFLRFLFFGELRDSLSDFVTSALGHVVPERIDERQLIAQFTSRGQAEDAYRMAVLYVEFRSIRDAGPATQTLAWWQDQAVDRVSLRAGVEWFDRVVDRLGRLLEREQQTLAARRLYETSPVAPARERLVRLLIKAGEKDEAMALLHAMRATPCHAEEAYVARQMLGRLEKTTERSEARALQQVSRSIVLDYPDDGVEAAVLAHYRRQGWNGVHSENWLWNASFGLLLWDIIYDPAIGTFHSPLQLAPSDLHEPMFYPRRRSAIEARLAMLAEPDAALALMRQHFEGKKGIANPFAYWRDELPDLLDVMVHRLPPAGHAAALRHLAQDVRRHSRGLPDLFLWNDSGYRFVEIKAENDHLAGHQYEWLRVLKNAGIEVALEKVERPLPAHVGREPTA